MSSKADIGSQSEVAGFDYYLRALDKKRETASAAYQLDLLRILADGGGKMRLYDLIKRYFRGEVTGDDWLELTSRLKKMQEAGLVSVKGVKGKEDDPTELRVELTDMGKTTLSVQGYSSSA